MTYYEKRKSAGLCAQCRVKLPEGATYVTCDTCRGKINDYSTKLYRERKSAGLCVDCGVKLATGTIFVRCFACRYRAAVSRSRNYARRHQKGEGQG